RREAAAGAGPLRPDGEPLRLVRLRARRQGRGAVADHRARRALLGGTMNKDYINPTKFYSHAVSIAGPGKVIHVSGQVSWDADGRVVGKGDMRAQAKQVFDNLTHVLKAARA